MCRTGRGAFLVSSPLVFFLIATADVEKSRAFYGELFDWDFDQTDAAATPVSIDPKGPADFDVHGSFQVLPEGAPPFVSVFFRVDDLWATVKKVEPLGGSIVVPVTHLGEGRPHIAIARSPEGHTIGIVQA
jgi:predicted enzyme related to lactoylglutathione lyase